MNFFKREKKPTEEEIACEQKRLKEQDARIKKELKINNQFRFIWQKIDEYALLRGRYPQRIIMEVNLWMRAVFGDHYSTNPPHPFFGGIPLVRADSKLCHFVQLEYGTELIELFDESDKMK